MPLFRDGQRFPWDTISSAGQGPVNARLLWENGINYGYGTDTGWAPRVRKLGADGKVTVLATVTSDEKKPSR